jgi:hypothetical protein
LWSGAVEPGGMIYKNGWIFLMIIHESSDWKMEMGIQGKLTPIFDWQILNRMIN